jgi:D-beta-D-heptose 7-phosphate kinase/D-beta-D-heptose 1-phosphate adenosyltransferase
VISRQQQLIRLDFDDLFPNWDSAELQYDFQGRLENADVVVLSDYAKGALRRSVDLITLARKAGKTVIVDPKGNDFARYRGASLITPNFAEFEAVVGPCPSEELIEQRATRLCDDLDLGAVLVTRGEKGMTLVARNAVPLHLPTRAQQVFDVTGAGDTVVATLAVALATGLSLDQAVAVSNVAAGIVVSKLGTATVTPAELHDALHRPPQSARRGVVSEEDLLTQVAAARVRRERVVMTNGCFDILHPGHIDYLEKARALGDRLVVAVNDDASVRRLKGEGRPVNTLTTRMRMLAALESVDWVVPFSEDTPERLLGAVLPDILVKGGDYTEDQIAGAACVKAAGGEVRVLEFIDGYSTSGLIDRIRKGAE